MLGVVTASTPDRDLQVVDVAVHAARVVAVAASALQTVAAAGHAIRVVSATTRRAS